MMQVMVYGAPLVIVGVFIWIVGEVLWKGVPQLSWEFLSELPADSGRSGGILSILISTVLILLVSLGMALPLGLASGIWLAEFAPQRHKLASSLSLLVDVLAGVPSIVFGLFGYAFFCLYLEFGYSILAGGLTLACMILPFFIKSAMSGLQSLPIEWRQAGAALGMSRVSQIWHVFLPHAVPMLFSGFMLAVGRAAGETAALLFTSGYVTRMPSDLMDPGRALTVHVYEMSMNVTGGESAAYGSATILLGTILLVHILATHIERRFTPLGIHSSSELAKTANPTAE